MEDTKGFGRAFGARACAGDVFALCGGLGAGKTAFTQGFAEGLGVGGGVTSPTFGLIHAHEGRLALYHFDAYRIKSEREMVDAGADDFLYGGGVCVVEWAEMMAGLLPEKAVWVKIEQSDTGNDNYRRITVEGYDGEIVGD